MGKGSYSLVTVTYRSLRRCSKDYLNVPPLRLHHIYDVGRSVRQCSVPLVYKLKEAPSQSHPKVKTRQSWYLDQVLFSKHGGEDRGTSRNCALAQTVLTPNQDSLEFLMAPSDQPHTTLYSCRTNTPRVCCIFKDQAQLRCSFGARMAMLGSLGRSKEREERDCACSLCMFSPPHCFA